MFWWVAGRREYRKARQGHYKGIVAGGGPGVKVERKEMERIYRDSHYLPGRVGTALVGNVNRVGGRP